MQRSQFAFVCMYVCMYVCVYNVYLSHFICVGAVSVVSSPNSCACESCNGAIYGTGQQEAIDVCKRVREPKWGMSSPSV